MTKNLVTVNQDSKLLLSKAKSLMGITKKLLEEKKKVLVDDSWIERLWKWADENDIPNCIIIQNLFGGGDHGIPKDKNKLLNLSELVLENNKLTKLPKEIDNLTILTELDLRDNPNLILTEKQIEWIIQLKKNGCEVDIDSNLLRQEEINPLVWKDPDTNLIWQVEIDERRFTWEESLKYAKDLNTKNYAGYNDWRVPSIGELRSLGNIQLRVSWENHSNWKKLNWNKGYDNPKSYSKKTFIKKPLLKSMTMEYQACWSTSISEDIKTYAWIINFYNGDVACIDKELNDCSVRCVRS